MTLQYENEVMFTCALKEFHYYRKEWQLKPAEILNCGHECIQPFCNKENCCPSSG